MRETRGEGDREAYEKRCNEDEIDRKYKNIHELTTKKKLTEEQ